VYVPQGRPRRVSRQIARLDIGRFEGDEPFLLIRHGCKRQVGKSELVLVIWRGGQVSSVKDKCRVCSSVITVRRIKAFRRAGTDRRLSEMRRT